MVRPVVLKDGVIANGEKGAIVIVPFISAKAFEVLTEVSAQISSATSSGIVGVPQKRITRVGNSNRKKSKVVLNAITKNTP